MTCNTSYLLQHGAVIDGELPFFSNSMRSTAVFEVLLYCGWHIDQPLRGAGKFLTYVPSTFVMN